MIPSNPFAGGGGGGAGTTFLEGRATTPPVASSDDTVFSSAGGIFDCSSGPSFCQPRTEITWSNNAATNPVRAPPVHDHDPILTRELGKLTPDEREKLYEEIHGIVNIPDEEPEFVETCLKQMEDEIQKIKKRAAYNKAHFLAPTKVKAREFRLMFLRGTSFDPRAAAKRIVTHFHNKAELFGEDKVAKIPLTLDDLDDDDLESLAGGSFQILPGKDMAGRSVALIARKFATFKNWRAGLRSHWYRIMLALENDIELQRKGIVHVGYDIGCRMSDHSQKYTDVVMKSHYLKDGVPYRMVAFHYCYDDPAIRTTLSLLRSVSGTSFRLHFRDHYGSHQECLYKLIQFGIPQSMWPLDVSGNLKQDFIGKYEVFDQFVRNQRQREEDEKIKLMEQEAVSNTIEAATDVDVLLGRGKPNQRHPGNLQLSKLIEERHIEYNSGDKARKVELSWEIVKAVQHELGGRFLEKDEISGEWKPVSDEAAREKVAYGFRSVKKQQANNSTRDVDMVDSRTGKKLRLE